MKGLNTTIFKTLSNSKRYSIQQGGTRSGKTYTIVYFLLVYAIKHPKTVISLVSESLPHLKRGVIRDVTAILDSEGWSHLFQHNKSEHTWVCSNGSMLECFSADDESKLRGSKRDILFINECNNVDHRAFDQLDVRTKYKTILDFNPTAKFFVHDKLMPKVPVTEYDFVVSTYKDNKHLTPEEVANIERRRDNKAWFDVYGEGKIGTLDGLVFSNWDIVAEFPQDAKLLGYGIDFGFVHSPSVIVEVRESEGELFVREHLYSTGISNEDMLVRAQRLDLNALAVADSADPKTIDYLFRKGWRGLRAATKGQDSILFGLNLLLDRKIHIMRESVNTIEEFRNYMWASDKDGNKMNRPVKDFDHAVDALRYLVMHPKKRAPAMGRL